MAVECETDSMEPVQSKTKRLTYRILLVIALVGSLYFASAFLIPIVLAALLAMLLTRVADRLEKAGTGRSVSSLVSVLFLIVAVLLLGGVLAWQLSQLTANIDEMRERLMGGVDSAREWISNTIGINAQEQEKVIEEQRKGASGQVILTIIDSMTSVLINAILVIAYTFLFLYYRGHLKRFALRIAPKEKKQDTDQIIRKSVALSGNYLNGLFSMIGMLWIMYGIGFGIIGLEGAIFFAIICGVLEIIPFVGNLVGTLLAIFAALAQGGDTGMVLGIVAIYLVVQFLQTYLLEPLVVGQQVNINPLFTIMGLVAGELLWGVAGLALAIPVIGIAKIICDNVPELRPIGELIGPTRAKKKTLFFGILKRKIAGK